MIAGIFCSLWVMSLIDRGVSQTYFSQSYESNLEHIESLENFIQASRGFKSDEAALVALGYVDEYQYDGKYAPWVMTKLGAVKLNSDGALIAICGGGSFLNDPGCAPDF